MATYRQTHLIMNEDINVFHFITIERYARIAFPYHHARQATTYDINYSFNNDF